jgi:hypothetical protein
VAVDVDLRALRASHRAHRAHSERLPPGSSANLLLFYAVECGLKAALIDRGKLRGTADLPEDLRDHDLRRLAPRLVDGLRDCRRRHDGGHVPVRDLHQAWRYGAVLEPDGERAATQALVAVSNWCTER